VKGRGIQGWIRIECSVREGREEEGGRDVHLQQVMVQCGQVIWRWRDLGHPCGQRLDAEEGIPAASFGRVRMRRDGWKEGGPKPEGCCCVWGEGKTSEDRGGGGDWGEGMWKVRPCGDARGTKAR